MREICYICRFYGLIFWLERAPSSEIVFRLHIQLIHYLMKGNFPSSIDNYFDWSKFIKLASMFSCALHCFCFAVRTPFIGTIILFFNFLIYGQLDSLYIMLVVFEELAPLCWFVVVYSARFLSRGWFLTRL